MECAAALPRRCTAAPLHGCTAAPLHRTPAPRRCTAPLHHCTAPWHGLQVLCCNSEGCLEADKLQQLVRIASETGAKVCLSTNWRLYDHLRAFLYEELAAAGIDVVGTTPDAQEEVESEVGMRPCEISGWLKCWHRKEMPRIESFVAVDDRALLQELGGAALQGALAPPVLAVASPPALWGHEVSLVAGHEPQDRDRSEI